MSENNQFKPCPFCGSHNIYRAAGSSYRYFIVQCIDCGANSGDIRKHNTTENLIDSKNNENNTETALRVWNTRV